MAALQAVAAFIDMLSGLPSSTLPAGRIGLARPASAAELPLITVSLAQARERLVGVGNLVQLAELAPQAWSETRGARVSGELHVELWSADAAAGAQLTAAVLDRVSAQAVALRAAGFLDLSLTALGPAQPSRAGAADAQMMPLVFSAVFEHLVTPPPGGEGVIRTVQVDLVGEVGERMDIQLPQSFTSGQHG